MIIWCCIFLLNWKFLMNMIIIHCIKDICIIKAYIIWRKVQEKVEVDLLLYFSEIQAQTMFLTKIPHFFRPFWTWNPKILPLICHKVLSCNSLIINNPGNQNHIPFKLICLYRKTRKMPFFQNYSLFGLKQTIDGRNQPGCFFSQLWYW